MQIAIMDKTNASQNTIEAVLALQKSLRYDAIKGTSRGFLVGIYSSQFLLNLLKDGAKIWVSLENDELLGYVITISSGHLFQLAGNGGKINLSVPQIEVEAALYIYQIGVKSSMQGTNIGRRLIAAIMAEQSEPSIVADILVEPITNKGSISFFTKCGFVKVGYLKAKDQYGFEKLGTDIFFRAKSAIIL